MYRLFFTLFASTLLVQGGNASSPTKVPTKPLSFQKESTPQQDNLKNGIIKIIKESRFGVLNREEITANLQYFFGEKFYQDNVEKVFQILDEAKSSKEGIIRLDNGYFTTPDILKTVQDISILLGQLAGKESQIIEKASQAWQEKIKAATQGSTINWAAVQFPYAKDGSFLAFGQGNALSEIFKANEGSTIRYPMYLLFEGAPGSGKTAGTIVRIIESIFAPHVASNPQDKTASLPLVYGTAPNEKGYQALQGDLTPVLKAYNINAQERVLPLETILSNANFPKGSVLIVDEIFTISLDNFLRLIKKAVDFDITLIFSGDSLQNLPNQPSIMGLLKRKAFLSHSIRASNLKHQDFPEIFIKDVPAALSIFEKNIYIANDLIIKNKLTKEALKTYERTNVKGKVCRYDPNCLMILADGKDINELSDMFHQALINRGLISGKIITRSVAYIDHTLRKKAFPKRDDALLVNRTIQLGRGSRIVLKDSFTQDNKIILPAGTSLVVTRTTDEGVVTASLATEENLKKLDDVSSPLQGEFTLKQEFKAFDLDYTKSSLDSQGASVIQSFVYLRKKLTTAELYVMLTRNKGECGPKDQETCNAGIEIFAPESQFQPIQGETNVTDRVTKHSWVDLNKEAAERMQMLTAVKSELVEPDKIVEAPKPVENKPGTKTEKKSGAKQVESK